MEPRVVDNPKESRYELWLGDTRAGFIDGIVHCGGYDPPALLAALAP